MIIAVADRQDDDPGSGINAVGQIEVGGETGEAEFLNRIASPGDRLYDGGIRGKRLEIKIIRGIRR